MSEMRRRTEQHMKKRKKMDRILNILIAVVALLIVICLVNIVLNDKDDSANKEDAKQEEAVKDKVTEEPNTDDAEKEDSKEADEEKINKEENATEEDETEDEKADLEDSEVVTKVDNDEYVEEIIENPNWKPVPTQQTGPHVSVYENGHPDYEEKLAAFRSAVGLDENNVIYYSVRNNGSNETSIAVFTSKDKSQKYRVSIEWVDGKGWKPVKVEKLKKLDGLVN